MFQELNKFLYTIHFKHVLGIIIICMRTACNSYLVLYAYRVHLPARQRLHFSLEKFLCKRIFSWFLITQMCAVFLWWNPVHFFARISVSVCVRESPLQTTNIISVNIYYYFYEKDACQRTSRRFSNYCAACRYTAKSRCSSPCHSVKSTAVNFLIHSMIWDLT